MQGARRPACSVGGVDETAPSSDIAERVASLAGSKPVSWRRILGGGYTPAERWVAQLSNGSSVFAKVGPTADTASWLRDERRVYGHLEAEFLPRMLGWDDDGGAPILLLEDLREGEWPPPWTIERVERVKGILDRVRRADPPDGLPSLEQGRDRLAGWTLVQDDRESFLALGVCSAAWLERALPVLIEAEESAVLSGAELVHLDVRSDNLCFLGERTLMADWNLACVGNGDIDLVAWAPSLTLEGGPATEEIAPGQPELTALIAGFFADRARLPHIPTAPRVRGFQLDQLRVALPWVARAFGLPPPTAGISCRDSGLGGPLPDRDVLLARGIERPAIPSTPAFPEAQSSQPGHEVEL